MNSYKYLSNLLYVRVQKGRFSVPRRWDEARNGVAERRQDYVSNGHFG
ncbi:hypothetical protein J2W91_001783 [Paenibacillus amylolyticus]|uniref:Uncharacterized protein n=1 Tax=Paenibacillus amylolyticus TaxID=1451 RepID=A0AAP5H3N4_PAEAM|nr:hypothetical protein [Paenibacillus amylolyticus]